MKDLEVWKVVHDMSKGREVADKYGIPRTTLSSIMNKRSRRDVTDLVDKDIGIG